MLKDRFFTNFRYIAGLARKQEYSEALIKRVSDEEFLLTGSLGEMDGELN
jgi:predicted mannosyl-3-phosphoglycerate phosphatase (HAD superfamily)